MRVHNVAALGIVLSGAFACDRPSATASAPILLPAKVVESRFVAMPVATNGDTLGFLLDTGGGFNMLWSEVATRLGLPRDSIDLGEDDGPTEKWGLVPWPKFQESASIPTASQIRVGEKLGVPPKALELDPAGNGGFLGRFWFANRIWVLDYPAGTLSRMPDGSAALPAGPHRVPLGFAQNVFRRRSTQFPRIRLAVDGDSIDMLFDTGATMTLTPSAVAALGGGPTNRGTAFIAQSIFEKWRAKHPDWRVIEGADSIGKKSMPIIEVPEVSIGGYTVGPSWWAMRPDRNYEPYVEWMDQPIHGSVGGSVFRYFRITLDYPHAVATFER